MRSEDETPSVLDAFLELLMPYEISLFRLRFGRFA